MILLLGASGYIGTAFGQQLSSQSREFQAVSRQHVNYCDLDTFRNFLRTEHPEFVINCAGYTGKPNVDACETDKANCLAGNALLPATIGTACREFGIPWGHVSSGCIYTGRRPDGDGFSEADPANFSFRQNNCSFYSGTKALGEELIERFEECYVWRLRIPFSNVDSSRNYLSKLLRYDSLLQAENSLSNLDEFVAAAFDCFTSRLEFGIYNLTNPASINTAEVIELIHDSGVSTKEFRFFKSEADFMQRTAKTPRSNCVLDVSKAIAAGLRLSPVRDAIRSALEQWVPQSCEDAPCTDDSVAEFAS